MHLPSRDAATSFVTPSAWRKPNITTAPEVRINLAQAAIEESLGRINIGTTLITSPTINTAVLYSQMATFDLLTNQTNYKDQLKTFFTMIAQTDSNFSFEEFIYTGLTYGYAAACAYAAYKDAAFLVWAQDNWNFGLDNTISQQQLDGTQPFNQKNFTLQAGCKGSTMAGGSFSVTNTTNTNINTLSTGGLLLNSALLAESAGDITYLQAAQASANFIHSHLTNLQTNVIQDSISAQRSDNCSVNAFPYAYNQGLAVEGLSILASLNSDSSDTQDFLYSIILPATTNPIWHAPNGIISISQDLWSSAGIGSDHLVRGAIAAYVHNPGNQDLRSYLRDYIGVQYNAVLDLATTGNDIYNGTTWLGDPSGHPMPATYSTDGQSLAISVLLAGISIQNDTISTGSPDSTGSGSPATSQLPAPHKSSVGPIAGGTVGGLVLVAMIIGAILFVQRRRKSHLTSRNIITAYVHGEPSQSTFREHLSAIPLSQPGSSDRPLSSTQPSDSRQMADDLIQLLAARLQSDLHQRGVESPPGYQTAIPGSRFNFSSITANTAADVSYNRPQK
ncbi:hypothetical protein C8J56DRAFT_362367 [Mycena floridula]|nr:hypothetical protein C8J56DRAFT_362367 [Mycena floridula]